MVVTINNFSDFTPDEFGNVVVVNPQTKETIRTEIPFDSYKD